MCEIPPLYGVSANERAVLDCGVSANQVDEVSQAVLPIKELQQWPEAEAHAEEHGGLQESRRLRPLQAPKGVGHHLLQHTLRQGAHLTGRDSG